MYVSVLTELSHYGFEIIVEAINEKIQGVSNLFLGSQMDSFTKYFNLPCYI